MVKINSLQLENIQRIKAVLIEPTPDGLTIIGGDNEQGKTSVLDGIAYALGGARFKPDEPKRRGSLTPPQLKIELSNGLVVERSGKNSDLKVTDKNGAKHGQALLNKFIETLALDLPRFMEASDKDKAQILLQSLGIEEELAELEYHEKALYDERHALGQIKERKAKAAEDMPYFPDAPDAEISASDLIKEQQAILARNGENERKRQKRAELERRNKELLSKRKELQEKLEEIEQELMTVGDDLETANMSVKDLKDESTAEIEASLQAIDETNQKVRINRRKKEAQDEATKLEAEYDGLTEEIEATRQARMRLLEGANLPLEELSVEDGKLTYQGFPWDNLSGSKQLKVATAIVRSLNPECGFVLIDKLEQMDLKTLEEFGEWAEKEGLQIIATRVSTGEECTLIIEDGYVKDQDLFPDKPKKPEQQFKKGAY